MSTRTTPDSASPLDIAERAFAEIRGAFPDLESRLDREPAGGLDLELVFPAQPGLLFEVALNLQNVDELHLSAADFWCEWFPCTRADVVTDYVAAVRGLIDGSHRLLQHQRKGRVVKTWLQRPTADDWETIARSYRGFSFPMLKYELAVVANSPVR